MGSARQRLCRVGRHGQSVRGSQSIRSVGLAETNRRVVHHGQWTNIREFGSEDDDRALKRVVLLGVPSA